MERPLNINLATSPFRNNTLPWTGLLLGVAIIGMLTFWNVSRYLQYNRSTNELKSRLGSYESQMVDLRTREQKAERIKKTFDLKALNLQTTKANDVIMLRSFSWTRLFNRLEKVLPYEVKMNSVRPMFRIGRQRNEQNDPTDKGIPIVVEGFAKSLEAFFDFERALLDDPFFDRIEPDVHIATESKEELFKIRFYYYPEEPPGEPAEDGDEPLDEGADKADAGGNQEVAS